MRHPLAEVLYREALTHSKINGTNFSFMLIDKPIQEASGISASIIQKKTNKKIDILIGNRKIMKNRNIFVESETVDTLESTVIFLVANKDACMVLFVL